MLSFLPVLFGESDLKRFVVSRVLDALCALGPTKTGVARVSCRSRCETHRASASRVFARSLAVMAPAIFFAEWLHKREDAQVVPEEGLEYSDVLLDTCRAIARDVDGGAVTILSIRMRVITAMPPTPVGIVALFESQAYIMCCGAVLGTLPRRKASWIVDLGLILCPRGQTLVWLWRIGSLLQAKSATLSGRLESAGTAGRTGRGRGIWLVPSFGFSLALSSPPAVQPVSGCSIPSSKWVRMKNIKEVSKKEHSGSSKKNLRSWARKDCKEHHSKDKTPFKIRKWLIMMEHGKS